MFNPTADPGHKMLRVMGRITARCHNAFRFVGDEEESPPKGLKHSSPTGGAPYEPNLGMGGELEVESWQKSVDGLDK